jgi:hypothetical protein
MHEWQRGGFELRRQRSSVSADNVALRDGEIDRYIEIRSSRGKRDAFDITRDERIAAMRSEIGSMYWIFVVEHLGDGQNPKVKAVWNLLADECVSTEPEESIVVEGWRASGRQLSLAFAHAAQAADSE